MIIAGRRAKDFLVIACFACHDNVFLSLDLEPLNDVTTVETLFGSLLILLYAVLIPSLFWFVVKSTS